MRRRFLLLSGSVVLALSTGCAALSGLDLERIMEGAPPLDQATVASGLKQALDVGVERTVSMLAAPGGFSNDPLIRLALPEELDPLAGTLRKIGFGGQVDALEVSMNLAAEAAAARAQPVFVSAIASMSIADAFRILNGPDDAATVYFRERTSDELRRQFQPIVGDAMRDVDLYAIYRELITQYERIPFVKPPAVDLERYVSDRTLEALFGQLALEEARIREDPAARSTALLRRVFGARTTAAH